MIFFNSSLPRSGSTLLQNILNQNDSIHATPTDGFLELIYGARVNYTSGAEFKAQDSEQMSSAWKGFCREGLNGYVGGLSDRQNTCIKSRGIGVNYRWFESFMGSKPKVICMVRDIRAIISSMEKIHRATPDISHSIENPLEMRGLTTESRTNEWLNSAPVGLSLQRMYQMGLEGIGQHCLFVRFEDLTTNPKDVMNKIYNYLELPVYEHDFTNVEQTTIEDDAVYGLSGDLHSIRKKVKYVEPDFNKILGENVCEMINNKCIGFQKEFNYIQ